MAVSSELSFPNAPTNSYRSSNGSLGSDYASYKQSRISMPSESFNLGSDSQWSNLPGNGSLNGSFNGSDNMSFDGSNGSISGLAINSYLGNNFGGGSDASLGGSASLVGVFSDRRDRSDRSSGVSRVRIFHGIHNNHRSLDGNLNLYMDGRPLSLNLNHNDFTAYMGCNSGAHVLTLKMAGDGIKVGDHKLDFESGRDYTIILWGKITKRGKLVFGVSLHGDFQTCPAPGYGVLQFINGAFSDRNVDVSDDNNELFSGIPFNHEELHHQILPVGTKNLRIRCAHSKEHLLGPIPLSLMSGGSYTLIIYRNKKSYHGLLIHNNPHDMECQKIVNNTSYHTLVGKWHHIGHLGPFGQNYNATTECSVLSTHIQTMTSFYDDNVLKGRLMGHVTPNHDNLGHFILNMEDGKEYAFVIHHHFPNIIIIGCPHRSSLFILSRKESIRSHSLEKIRNFIRQLAYDGDALVICPNTVRDHQEE